MTKSRIEWLKSADGRPGYSINPVKGKCPVACPYCYARRLYDRFNWNPEIRFEPLDYKKFPDGSKVFVGSTMELFGDWVKPTWLDQIFEWCKRLPKVNFIFLTKQPQNLPKEWPDNCWVGASATDAQQLSRAYTGLKRIQASVKFISFEPLKEAIVMPTQYIEDAGISWLIIGQQTPAKASTEPKTAWIQDILVAASNAGNIPVFIKENLRPLLEREWPGWNIRQEFPKVERK